jgi:hypothetical protein
MATVSVSVLIGELASRGFYIFKSKCKSSNLKEKYSILDFFTRTEKTAALVIAPLSAAYLVVCYACMIINYEMLKIALSQKHWENCSKVLAPFSLIFFLYRVYTVSIGHFS